MLFKFAPLALAGVTYADWGQIQANIDYVMNNTTLLFDMAMTIAQNGGVVDRALTQNDMGQLNGYGCWCYFEDDHGKGRGKPIDEVDAECKRLQDGYFCAIQDHMNAAGVSSCEPWSVIYASGIGIGLGSMTIQNIITECELGNTDSCGNAACKIEGNFVIQFLQDILTGSAINQEYRHSNGFDKFEYCPISGNGIKSEKECCGEHPNRFPFKSYGGNRMCCLGHTFNTALYSCCPDGTVKISC